MSCSVLPNPVSSAIIQPCIQRSFNLAAAGLRRLVASSSSTLSRMLSPSRAHQGLSGRGIKELDKRQRHVQYNTSAQYMKHVSFHYQ